MPQPQGDQGPRGSETQSSPLWSCSPKVSPSWRGLTPPPALWTPGPAGWKVQLCSRWGRRTGLPGLRSAEWGWGSLPLHLRLRELSSWGMLCTSDGPLQPLPTALANRVIHWQSACFCISLCMCTRVCMCARAPPHVRWCRMLVSVTPPVS